MCPFGCPRAVAVARAGVHAEAYGTSRWAQTGAVTEVRAGRACRADRRAAPFRAEALQDD